MLYSSIVFSCMLSSVENPFAEFLDSTFFQSLEQVRNNPALLPSMLEDLRHNNRGLFEVNNMCSLV